jgi:hypothetical protein
MFLVPSKPNTSRLSIYMFITFTILETSPFNIALQTRCWPISSPNPFGDLNSVCSGHSSQIAPRIILKSLLLFLIRLYNPFLLIFRQSPESLRSHLCHGSVFRQSLLHAVNKTGLLTTRNTASLVNGTRLL